VAIERKARKLVESIETVAGKAMAQKITADLKEPTASTTPRRKAEWAREVIARMDALLPEEQRRAIMGLRRCPSPMGWARRNRKMWECCADLEEFARNIREGGWANYFCEGDTLRYQISSGWCHCGLVRGREAPISKTYCLCCAEHVRHALEHVFDGPVRVEPLSTVISGDEECWFVAHIPRGGRHPVTPEASGADKGGA